MKVLYYYMNDYPRSQRAVRKFWPEAEFIYTTPGEECLYPESVADHWDKGDSLLIIEGDIVPTPIDFARMQDCNATWCTCWYPLGTGKYPFRYGYGFVKFSAEFQANFSYDRILRHNNSGCLICEAIKANSHGAKCEHCGNSCCHRHQDTAMWHEMIKLGGFGVAPHNHGYVQHLHTGARRLKVAEAGVYIWEDEVSQPLVLQHW